MNRWIVARSGGDQYLWNCSTELGSHTSVKIDQFVAQCDPSYMIR